MGGLKRNYRIKPYTMITYNIQLAGYDHLQVDEKGPIDFTGFIQVLHNFPWKAELEKTGGEQFQGVSPTLSAKHKADEKALWVSAFGEPDKPVFLLGVVYMREKKGFLGLGSSKIVKWVDIYELHNLPDMEAYFALFFRGAYQELKDALMELKLHSASEAFS